MPNQFCHNVKIRDRAGMRMTKTFRIENITSIIGTASIRVGVCAIGLSLLGCQANILDTQKLTASKPDSQRVIPTSNKTNKTNISKEIPNKDAAKLQFAVANEQLRHGFDADALSRYEKARQLDPNLKGVAHPVAVIHDTRGDHSLAIAEYRKAIQEKPRDPNVLNDMGYSYYLKGDWTKAEEAFRASIKIKDNPRAWNNLGLALGQQGKYREAFAAFEKATDAAHAYGNLGFIYLTQGKTENARRAYQNALERDPTFDLARQILAQIDSMETKLLSPAMEKTNLERPESVRR